MKISAVMGVFNGAATLPATLDSILAQTDGDFELIVVDDGSSDQTPDVLRRYAAEDGRIRIIRQANAGLTRALVAGCEAARGEFIARHDNGDRSRPDRFARQLAAFAPGVVLVSCGARHVGPDSEFLYDATAAGDIGASLLHDPVERIRGLPHHGTAMFRRDAYIAAGGYREQFRYAQDLDLWIRLAGRGRVVVLPEILYEARFETNAISATRRGDQVALAGIAIALRDGAGPSLLESAREIGSAPRTRRRRDETAALYFVASCLRRNRNPGYKRYARAVLRRNPFHLRSWLLLMR
jgi:glycosyltransferase involved in cell wall biosynthesis